MADKPTTEEVDGDAVALGTLLLSVGVLTPVSALAEALGWPLDRLHQAVVELARRLEGVGASLRRSTARLAIVTVSIAVTPETLQTTLRRHLGRDHVRFQEARILRHVEHRNVPTQPSNTEHVGMGVLVNAGLVAFGEPPMKTEAPSRFPTTSASI